VVGETDDQFGYSCALMDLNGDGLDGLVGGAPYQGFVVVFEEAPTDVVSRTDADTLIQGNEFFGFSLAHGDIDGDGYEDLLVGSPIEDLGGSRSGTVFLYTDPVSASQDLDAVAHYDGPTPSDEAGRSVSVGDVDVDGTVDLLVGLPEGAGGLGAVHLVLSPPTSGAVDLGEADAAFEGWAQDGSFGRSLELVDLDGDTDLDLVMGAPYESSAAGGVWIWLTPGL